MLGKLFKHEWRRVYKLECLLLGIMAAFTVVEAIMFFTPMTDFLRGSISMSSNDPMGLFWTMMFMVSMFACIMIMMGLLYGHLIFMGVNFEKTMYADEGYLTHTLPVTPHQLLGSKLLVGGIWMMIIQFAMYFCIFVLMEALFLAVEDVNILAELPKLIQVMDFSKISAEGIGVLVHYVLIYALLLFGSPFCTMGTLYGALTIGQLSKKHKGLMGILAYFGITFATTLLSNIAQVIGVTTTRTTNNPHTMLFFSLDLTMILTAAVAICLYFLSHYIIVKKLNLN